MHKGTTEHSTPEVIGDHKVYKVNGSPFEVPKKYVILKALGFGAYGLVCSALNTETGNKVAIKKCRDVFRDVEDGKRVLREIALMRFLKHDNLLPIVDILPPREGLGFNDVYVVMPLMDVDLNIVLRSKQSLEENHYQYFIYQMLRGLQYMHSAKIAHRDLKPANLVTTISCHLKICDFGLARELENLDQALTDYVVTRWYRPPELLLQSTNYNQAVDIWSTGVIFAELYSRKPLFKGKTSVEQLAMLCRTFGRPSLEGITDKHALRRLSAIPETTPLPISEWCPNMTNPLAQDFASKMLQMDPKNRWSASELLRHPFLADVYEASEDAFADAKSTFTWEYEHCRDMTLAELRGGFWREICTFNPNLAFRPAAAVGFGPEQVMLGCAPSAGLYHRDLSVEEVTGLLTKAFTEHGVRAFDTAPWYGCGRSELDIGRAFAAGRGEQKGAAEGDGETTPPSALPPPSTLAPVRIYTKVGRYILPRSACREDDPAVAWGDQCYSFARDTGADVCVHDYTAGGIIRSWRQSQQRLGLTAAAPNVHCLRLHDCEDAKRMAQATADDGTGGVEALISLRNSGEVREIGLGMNSPAHILQLLRRYRGEFDNVLMAGAWNLIDQSGYEVLKECEAQGVAVHIAGVFGAGLLWGGSNYRYREAPPEVIARREALVAICAKRGVALPELAVHFATRPLAVTHVVIGCATIDELRGCIALIEKSHKDAEHAARLGAALGDCVAEGLLPKECVPPCAGTQ